MAESLKDILSGRARPQEPPEAIKIKQYVRKNYNQDVGVKVRQRTVVIQVSNASFAGALRQELHVIKETIQTDKSLRIQIVYS